MAQIGSVSPNPMSLIIATNASRNRQSLKKRWAYEMARGKTGGAFGMNLFDVTGYSNTTEAEINAWHNARDPGETPYAYNPNLWCADLLPQLTCCAIHKDDCGTGEGAVGEAWRARYGGVAITPQHVLYCAHAYTHAAGTWSINPSITAPTRIRFIDGEGNTIDRVQLHQASAYDSNAATENGANADDLCVAVLDSPLPSTIFIPKVCHDGTWMAEYDMIALSQEFQPQSGATKTDTTCPWGNYPDKNRQMVHVTRALGQINRYQFPGQPAPQMPDYTYAVWGGDSGTPAFIMLNDELTVVGLIGATGSASYPMGTFTFADRLNALIALADAYAVSMGRLTEPTGYTVTEAEP